MADEGNVISNLEMGSMPNGADNEPAAGIISQYIKDLSVENPNAPESYQWEDQPQIDIQFNIGARVVAEDVQEVELKINIQAKASAGTAYIVELAYAGLAGTRNLDAAQQHAFFFAEVPRILFPFARAIVANVVRDAGFAPLMLEPIDFNGLYLQQLAAQQQAQAEGGEGSVGGEPVGNA